MLTTGAHDPKKLLPTEWGEAVCCADLLYISSRFAGVVFPACHAHAAPRPSTADASKNPLQAFSSVNLRYKELVLPSSSKNLLKYLLQHKFHFPLYHNRLLNWNVFLECRDNLVFISTLSKDLAFCLVHSKHSINAHCMDAHCMDAEITTKSRTGFILALME